MIKKLPFIFLLMFSMSIAAQTENITIDWSFNSTPSATGNANSSRTIEVGDTVTWNWYSGGSHNVKSNEFQTIWLSMGSRLVKVNCFSDWF